MAVNEGGQGWPFHNHAMAVRGTQTPRGPSRHTIVYPRNKFTFVVEFFINEMALQSDRMQTNLPEFLHNGRIYAALRSIDHPQITFNVEKLRSYNKHVLVPTRTDYASASMNFHDDNSSMSLALWREYRAYYQHEGTIGATSVANGSPANTSIDEFRSANPLYGSDVRAEQTTRASLGMTLKANNGRHFFDAIRIFDLGADPDSVNIYTYIYPMITSINHEALNYEDREGQMGVTFNFDYEGYYHLTGLNNSSFHDAINVQLGTVSSTTSYNVGGHANMNTTAQPTPSDSTIGTGFPINQNIGLIKSVEGILGTSSDNISFANVANIPIANTTVKNTSVGGNVAISSEYIAALTARTLNLG